jgi:hypothetical protein
LNIAKISVVSGSLMLAATSTVSAGPMSVAGLNVVAPPSQVERVQWWPGYYGYGWYPGAAVAGAALGLLSLGTLGAISGYPYYYGYPYGYYAGYWPHYRYGYYRPYYRHYAYWHPYRHYAYYRTVYVGRSVGYYHHRHHRWHCHY